MLRICSGKSGHCSLPDAKTEPANMRLGSDILGGLGERGGKTRLKAIYNTCFKHLVRRLSFNGTSQEKRTSLLNPRIRFLYPPLPPQSPLNYVHLRFPSHLKLCTRKYVLPLPTPLLLYLPHNCHGKKAGIPQMRKKKEEVIVINHHHKHRAFGSPSPISCRSFCVGKLPKFSLTEKKTKASLSPTEEQNASPARVEESGKVAVMQQESKRSRR
ncbi:hypothetical protein BGZ57DRAFT_432283 [Hyaloscypha finlandica]|nr:hypothetical protein BGZ57DRAFT_432283 [Hyaloscypha finlandica]